MRAEIGSQSQEQLFKETGLTKSAEVALTCVRLGARRLLQYHGLSKEKLHTIYKKDNTAVTIADTESEKIMLQYLKGYFPYDRYYGEETGISGNEASANTIYIDPLDGTNPFTHGEPFSTVGFARREQERTTLGAICLPFSHEVVIAELGKGAWRFPLDDKLNINGDPKRMQVSTKADLASSVLYLDANLFEKNGMRKLEFLKQIRQGMPADGSISLRMVCSNIGQQARVAMGQGDFTLTDCVGGPYDFFAGEVIIQEAGGKFTGLDGNPVNEFSQVAVGSNGTVLHDSLLGILQPLYDTYQGFK